MSAVRRADTAATAYAYHQGLALHRLERVRKALDAHQATAAAQPRKWGFPGDVEAAGQKLLEALAALGALTPQERETHRV
ncbi:MAG: hypothetical protein Q8N13_11255 [Acidovorax sp.]|nr:hypothetical protein [Acidovorax sp.]